MKSKLGNIFKLSGLAVASAAIVVGALLLFTDNKAKAAPSCTITGAYFDPSGDMADGWYKDSKHPPVKLTIEGQNCAGKTVEVSIVEADGVGMDDDISGMDNREFTFPANSNVFTIYLNAGEDECEGVTSTGSIGNDCNYYIHVTSGILPWPYNSQGKSKGELNYECDYLCRDDWYVSPTITSPVPNTNPAPSGQTTSGQGTNINACVAADGKYACDPGKQDAAKYSQYQIACQGRQTVQILSSLCGQNASPQGNTTTASPNVGDGNQSGRIVKVDCLKLDKNHPDYPKYCIYNPLPVDALTEMLLLIMNGFLGITAIWAVTFIIIGGFKMVMSQGNEEAYTAAKKTITWAVLGLAIALLSFAIIAMVQEFLQADVKKLSKNQTNIQKQL